MGKYDDILSALPPEEHSTTSGKYDDILAGLPDTKQPKISLMNALGFASDMTPANIIRRHTFDPAGEKIAEVAGRSNNPYVRAAGVDLGVGVQMLPDTAAALLGPTELYESQNPTVKGLLNTTKELGKDYSAQNKAIGVTRRVPPEGGMAPRYAPQERLAPTPQPRPIEPAQPVPSNIPVRYPSKPGDFMAYANGRLNNAAKGIAPQELMDWQVKLQTDMNNGTIPKFDKETGRITTIFQQATELMNRTKGAFNQGAEPLLKNANLPEGVMKTREGLNEAFGMAANREAEGVVKALFKRYGPEVIKAAIYATGLGAGIGITGGRR